MSNNIGLFIASYEITTDLVGAPALRVDLSIDVVKKEVVSGVAHISQATNPPLDLSAYRLSGNYYYMCVMPDTCHIAMDVTGWEMPEISPKIPGEHVGIVIADTLKLKLVLNDDWQSGKAGYQYREGFGDNWKKVENANVKLLSPQCISQHKKVEELETA